MKLINLIEQMTWKQIAFISLGVLISFLVIHDILLMSYITDIKTSFNEQFIQTQASIQKKIADSESEAKRRESAFNKEREDFDKKTWDAHNKMKELMDEEEKQQAEATAKFNKMFAEMPTILEKQFENRGKEMERDFFKSVEKMDKAFDKHIEKLKK